LAGSREQGKIQSYRLWGPGLCGGRLLMVVINRIR
jgi:hypothetical protein